MRETTFKLTETDRCRAPACSRPVYAEFDADGLCVECAEMPDSTPIAGLCSEDCCRREARRGVE